MKLKKIVAVQAYTALMNLNMVGLEIQRQVEFVIFLRKCKEVFEEVLEVERKVLTKPEQPTPEEAEAIKKLHESDSGIEFSLTLDEVKALMESNKITANVGIALMDLVGN